MFMLVLDCHLKMQLNCNAPSKAISRSRPRTTAPTWESSIGLQHLDIRAEAIDGRQWLIDPTSPGDKFLIGLTKEGEDVERRHIVRENTLIIET